MTTTAADLDETDDRPLDDVLLAMDVVDTLRHRERVVADELDAEGREEALIERLGEIYEAQGIDVPERILRDGVKALDERRFLYEPPKASFSVWLAKIYVSRDRWMKPLIGAVMAVLIGFGIYEFGVAGPSRAAAEAEREILAKTIPAELETLRAAVQEAATEDRARRLAESFYQTGMAAAATDNKTDAEAARDALLELRSDVAQTYEVRVVYAGGQETGFFRTPDNVPGGRNYYLIVEAINPAGDPVFVTMTSEETRETKRVNRWGQRVTQDVFESIAADKSDDQIVQNSLLGEKPAGRITPIYKVETPGGAIFEW